MAPGGVDFRHSPGDAHPENRKGAEVRSGRMKPISLFPFSENSYVPLSEVKAREEVIAWLRQTAGQVHSLRDEDTSRHRSGELVRRFLSYAEPCGFKLSSLATGSEAAPRFVGEWSWHGHTVRLSIPDSADRDGAWVMACAALLREEILKHRIVGRRFFSRAA